MATELQHRERKQIDVTTMNHVMHTTSAAFNNVRQRILLIRASLKYVKRRECIVTMSRLTGINHAADTRVYHKTGLELSSTEPTSKSPATRQQ